MFSSDNKVVVPKPANVSLGLILGEENASLGTKRSSYFINSNAGLSGKHSVLVSFLKIILGLVNFT